MRDRAAIIGILDETNPGDVMMIVGVKTGGSRVGVPNCASRPDGNRRQGTQCFTQVRALLMEVKPYVLLD